MIFDRSLFIKNSWLLFLGLAFHNRFAQTTPSQPPEIIHFQQVRPLPGKLNNIPVFNSNSPEIVQKDGILLSTFPPTGKKSPNAHLNFAFTGEFEIFAHHIAKAEPLSNLRTLYLGILVHNPGKKAVKLSVRQGASYLSQPDAPFIELPPFVENPDGKIYAGPGGRVMTEMLRGETQSKWSDRLNIPPGESIMLMNHPIPVRNLLQPINGRSTLIKLKTDGEVYVASLGMFAPLNEQGKERSPLLSEWEELLQNGELVTPRDRVPTPPEQKTSQIIYGRVAGVVQGSLWEAKITDRPDFIPLIQPEPGMIPEPGQVYRYPTNIWEKSGEHLTIPQPGQAYSYGINTLPGGTLGTLQVQSAPMLVRYPDTAYRAHGNYGIEYHLTIPLFNPSTEKRIVNLLFQTPIKEDLLTKKGLRFFSELPKQTFFRGTILVRFTDENGKRQNRYIHLVQRRGQQGEPLLKMAIEPRRVQSVEINFFYPPDATPPQVLTIQTE